ncbi:hypothetical protein [Micromonospora sp. MH99]|uniref:hypothetical protein n=1 Tax=Micromonospora sp. MH99 TaxID=1945510 RepID=UPI001F35A55E|nr:hypothetical protein [Micromonospora sp. MH99]
MAQLSSGVAATAYLPAVSFIDSMSLISDLDLGDVPAWGSFVTTLGAFVAAIWAGRTARRLYERESARDQRAEEDRRERSEEQRRAQAVQVCGWFGTTPITGVMGGSWCAWMQNASRVPVHDVKVEFYFRKFGTEEEPDLRDTKLMSVLPPATEPRVVIPDGDLTRETGELDAYGDPVVLETTKDFAVAIEFTDAAGYRWRRNIRGQLTELPIKEH